MEKKFDDNEFEHFLKENSDSFRMVPSERVWNGIMNALHGRRRWYGVGLILLLLTAGLVTWVMLLNPAAETKQQISSTQPDSNNTPGVIQENTLAAIEEPQILVLQEPAVSTDVPRRQTAFYTSSSAVNMLTSPSGSEEPAVLANEDETVPAKEAIPVNLPAPAVNNKTINNSIAASPDKKPEAVYSGHNITGHATVSALNEEEKETSNVAVPTNRFNNNEDYPLTIESVINSYTHKKYKARMTWQAYVVPTISYRKLQENMTFFRAARSNGTIDPGVLPPDINSAVTHKPDFGFELGVGGRLQLSKNFSVLAGLQFNVSKYDIRAYDYQTEIASVILSTGTGMRSVYTTSQYRNFGNSNDANWLKNLYLSASAPIGFEIQLDSRKKTYGGFAATLQPTYVLRNETYMLSADFKNYVEMPSLNRQWNLNTGFEVFVGHSGKKADFRVGPQVRYQTLSSFTDKYPIKENLFDFGLKLGVVLK